MSETFSKTHGLLNQLLLQKPALAQETVNFDRADVAEFMLDYEYEMSTWPVVVSQSLIAQFDHFNRHLCPLIAKAVKGFFKDDSEHFARYLNVPGIILELFNSIELDIKSIVSRHDLIFSDGQFKLIEINAGSTIGGWQHDWLYKAFAQVLAQQPETNKWHLKYTPVMAQMFAAVLNAVVRAAKPGATGNVLLAKFFTNEKGQTFEGLAQGMSAVFDKAKQTLMPQAQLLFFDDFEQLKFNDNGSVFYQRKEIDAVLLPLPVGFGISQSVSLKLMSSFVKNKIVFPDSPLHHLFGNKHLLSLLHEPALRTLLSEAEQQLIENHIPWSTKMADKMVIYQGKEQPLVALLKNQKDQFVLKKSQSYQGIDVVVGKYCQQQQWGQWVEKLINEDDWLAQQFCTPDVVPACDKSLGVVGHQMVWGIFDFDGGYCGAFVRGAAQNSKNGVINSANGATEFIVFEEQLKKRRVVI